MEYNGYSDVILTGVFNTQTGEEQPVNYWLLPHAKTHKKDASLEKLHEIVNNNEEGYVVRFSNGERCKIKGAEYFEIT